MKADTASVVGAAKELSTTILPWYAGYRRKAMIVGAVSLAWLGFRALTSRSQGLENTVDKVKRTVKANIPNRKRSDASDAVTDAVH